MLKRFNLFLAVCSLALITACAGMPGGAPASPAQQALNLTAQTCKTNDAAIVAATQAIDAGVLKGNDARRARDGLGAIQTGCVTSLAALQAAAASAPR